VYYFPFIGDAFQLFPGSMKVDGKKLGVLNDLDIASDGIIYFTETTPYRRENFMLEFLEGRAQGRLIFTTVVFPR